MMFKAWVSPARPDFDLSGADTPTQSRLECHPCGALDTFISKVERSEEKWGREDFVNLATCIITQPSFQGADKALGEYLGALVQWSHPDDLHEGTLVGRHIVCSIGREEVFT